MLYTQYFLFNYVFLASKTKYKYIFYLSFYIVRSHICVISYIIQG